MRRIDLSFLLLATLCLTAGVSLGIWMGIAHDFALAPVHAHLNLLGWASLALFGLAYRAWPVMAASPLALVHFCLSAPAAVLFPAGIWFAIARHQPGLAIAAALLWLAGVLVFLAGLVRVLLREPAERAGRAIGVPAE